MERITRRDLEGTCRALNFRTGFKDDAQLWRRIGEQNVATVGMYYIDGAYGGWALYRMVSEGGGVRDVFSCGHQPARDLYNRMQAFLDGWDAREVKGVQ